MTPAERLSAAVDSVARTRRIVAERLGQPDLGDGLRSRCEAAERLATEADTEVSSYIELLRRALAKNVELRGRLADLLELLRRPHPGQSDDYQLGTRDAAHLLFRILEERP